MTSPTPQWTVEFTVHDNKTGARRGVSIDAPELPDAVAGAVAGIQAVFGSEVARGVRVAEEKLNGFINVVRSSSGG